MGLRFKTESHGGQRDSSLRERGLLLWGGDGTPFAVNRDSFCRQLGLLLPCNATPFAVIWDSSPPTLSLALDNKTTRRQVFKTTTLPTCLPPKTQRPKDSDFEKYFLRKCGEFPGSDLQCIVFLSLLIRLLDNKTTSKKFPHITRRYKNIPICTREIIFRDRCLSVFVS